MSKLIVVTGITGNQGSSVAETFLKESGWSVRGTTRDPSSEKAKAWEAKGVEMVKADADDVSSLKSAFQAATVIFALTDFWTLAWAAAQQQTVKMEEIQEHCYKGEVQHGKNMADAAGTVQGLERFIYSGLPRTSTYGEYKHSWHIDSKAAIMDYIRDHCPELNKKTSDIQLSTYMENWQWQMPTMPRKAADGTYHLACVGKGDKPLYFTSAKHDTGPLVLGLVNYKPGVVLSANSDVLSWKDWLKIFCETQKVPYGGYDEISFDDFAKSIPVPPLGQELAENHALLEDVYEAVQAGKQKLLLPKDIGVKTQTFRDYCETTDFSKILA